MRIGFDSKRLYSNFTGLGNYSRTLVKNLQKFYSNDEYYLYTTKLKKTPETSFFYDSSNFNTYTAKTAFKSFWRSVSVVNQLQKDKIDLYHGLSNEVPTNLKKTKIKSIVTIHDLIFKILPQTYPAIDRHIYDLKFRKSCQSADRIIAISNSTKKDLINFYNINPDKIDVIYQSCNPLFYENSKNEDSEAILKKHGIPNEFLLFVGSIEKRKNLKLLINAYQYLSPDLQIPLVIVGGNKSHKDELLEMIKAKKLEKKVLWIVDLKDNNHLKIIYKKAMALIYPSLYEGFGLPVAEALLSKTPVITSNVSSLPEAGGPNTLYIDPTNSEELADAIKKVLTNSELRKTMIHNGYEYAIQNLGPEVVSNKLMGCYTKTLQQ